MNILITDPEVQAALITAVSTVMASIIAAIIAAIIGKHISDRQRLLEKLEIAAHDIDFLLHVEQIHCNAIKESAGTSPKNKVRELARQNGKTWSGKLTPSTSRKRGLLS